MLLPLQQQQLLLVPQNQSQLQAAALKTCKRSPRQRRYV
jgi:hypothetical protein